MINIGEKNNNNWKERNDMCQFFAFFFYLRRDIFLQRKIKLFIKSILSCYDALEHHSIEEI